MKKYPNAFESDSLAAMSQAAQHSADAATRATDAVNTIGNMESSISRVEQALANPQGAKVGRLEHVLGFRPSFAFVGTTSSTSTTKVGLYRSGETTPSYIGSLDGNASQILGFENAAGTEMYDSNYWPKGSSGALGNSGINPSSGNNGTSAFSQYATFLNFDINCDGYSPRYYTQISLAAVIPGIVLGEDKDYKNGLMLGIYGGLIYTNWGSQLSNSDMQRNNSKHRLTISGLTGLDTTGVNLNNAWGSIAYNRKTKMLAFMAYKGSNRYFRLYWFRLQEHPRPGDAEHLKAQMEYAINPPPGYTGPALHGFHEFDSNVGGGTAHSDTEWHNVSRIVPCDDDTFWVMKKQSNNGTYLYRVTGSPGSYTTAHVAKSNDTTSYGMPQGNYYASRFMVSEDQSRVLLFHWYHYYGCGISAFLVDRKSAVNGWGTFHVTQSNYGYSVAPCGGPDFAVNYMHNSDNNYGQYTYKIDGSRISSDYPGGDGQALTNVSNAFHVSFQSGSTNYNSGFFVHLKRVDQLTTEWEEKEAREAAGA